MVNIILDTNFLLIPAQFGVDIFAEISRVCDQHTLWIMESTIAELQAIARKRGRNGAAAKVALELARRHDLQQIPSTENVDSAILAHATEGWIVGTQDRALRAQLRRKHIPLLTLKGKSHLAIEG